jgi:hypothetical protein
MLESQTVLAFGNPSNRPVTELARKRPNRAMVEVPCEDLFFKERRVSHYKRFSVFRPRYNVVKSIGYGTFEHTKEPLWEEYFPFACLM